MMESIEDYLSWCEEKGRIPDRGDNLTEYCRSSRA